MKTIRPPWNLGVIPEEWENVQAFADWWLEKGMPFIMPRAAETFCTDDATSTAIFRRNKFQVELYLIHADPVVTGHEHPGVEVIQMRMKAPYWGVMSDPLLDGQQHGVEASTDEDNKRGVALLAFEHWKTCNPSTVAAMWKGPTVGPKHEALIRRFNPDAYIADGYADITKKAGEQ